MAPRRSRRTLPTKHLLIDLTAAAAEDDDQDGSAHPDEEVLNVIAGNPITPYHRQILQTGAWLNDEIINAYLHTLQSPSVAALSTFFHPKLCKEGPESESLRRWLRPLQPVSSRRLVLVPINLNNAHWALLAYHVHSRQACYYDSMLHRRSAMGILERYRPVFTYLYSLEESMQAKDDSEGFLSSLLEKLTLTAPGAPDSSPRPVELSIPEPQPRQLDGSSCGAFVCKWAQVLSAGSTDGKFSQSDVTKHRKTVLDTLLNFQDKNV